MNEKFNTNAKVEQLTKVVLSHGEEKGLIVKDPFFSSLFYEKVGIVGGFEEKVGKSRIKTKK